MGGLRSMPGLISARYDGMVDLPQTWFDWTDQILSALTSPSSSVSTTSLASVGLARFCTTLEVRAPPLQIVVALNRCEYGIRSRAPAACQTSLGIKP